MTINYEVEYDNRGRVKDHPEIFARWEREAKAYREASAAHGAKFGVSYGSTERQIYDRFPATAEKREGRAPLAVFIHGGYWRSLHPSQFSQCAKGPNAHGIDVAVVGYDLCPHVSIAAIIAQMQAFCLHLWSRRQQRLMVYGHSAGGHLAACMAATDWKSLSPEAPEDLVPAAYAISGVFDLIPLLQVSQNNDLRLKNEAEAREVSPLYWDVPAARVIDAVVGGDESSEFIRQSKTLAQAWRQGLSTTRYEALPGANHFTVVDPLSDPTSAMTKRVVELSRKVAEV